MITVIVGDKTAAVGIETVYGKFYTTYLNDMFLCYNQCADGWMRGETKSVLLQSLNAEAMLSMALEAVGENPAKAGAAHIICDWIGKTSSGGMVGSYSFPKNPDKFSKGLTASAFGYIAELLKKGLGEGETCTGLKMKWTAEDLLEYVAEIQGRRVNKSGLNISNFSV